MTTDSTHDTAGAGSPAPAVVSAHPGEEGTDAVAPASVDVVPEPARTELDRIRRRWEQLPLAQAERRMPLLRRLLADLAARSVPGATVPDLGPGVVVDQVSVLVWDAYAGGQGDGLPDLLTAARRDLS